jgi:hypothetical protein
MKDASVENQRNAEGWVEVIRHYLENLGDIVFFGLEVGLPIFPDLGCFGTADALIVGSKGCALIDFKNGVGHNVGAGTPQLRTYMASITNYAENIPEWYEFNAVVYQPNIDEAPKSMTYSKSDIDEHASDILYAIEAAEGDSAQPNLGNHCYWCPAKRAKDPRKKCPAIIKKDIETAGSEFDAVLGQLQPVSGGLVSMSDIQRRDKGLIKLMSMLPVFNNLAKEAAEEFEARIKNGEVIEGVEIVEKQGNREWVKDKELEKKIKGLYNIEPTVLPPPRTKTVTEVEKEVGKKKFAQCDLVMRKSSKKLVVKEDTVNEILKEFSNFAQLDF